MGGVFPCSLKLKPKRQLMFYENQHHVKGRCHLSHLSRVPFGPRVRARRRRWGSSSFGSRQGTLLHGAGQNE